MSLLKAFAKHITSPSTGNTGRRHGIFIDAAKRQYRISYGNGIGETCIEIMYFPMCVDKDVMQRELTLLLLRHLP